MKTQSVKLRVEGLEDRTVLAAFPAGVRVALMAQALAPVLEDYEWMRHPSAIPAVSRFLKGFYEDALAAGMPAMAGLATSLADYAGIRLTPLPTAPPTRPSVPANDFGMTDTLPNINASNWVARPNGLKTWDVVQGRGEPVAAGDSIRIFYTGWLLNGTRFDARRSPQAPITFQLNNLIEGWKQGIPGMRPGGIRRLYVPAALGYGATGTGTIPPNSDLVFEIKLISHS